jgi:AmiR/NasT family two-component response regulator
VRTTKVTGFRLSSDVQNIIELLGPREVIGQAVSLLMASRGVSRDAAFGLLVCDSARSHQTVRQIAATLVMQGD